MSDAFGDYMENAIRDTVFRTGPTISVFATGAVTAGTVVFPTTADGYLYLCTTGGTTTVEPTWVNSSIGAETTAEGVTWECCKPGVIKKELQIRLFFSASSLAALEAGTLTNEVDDANYVPVSIAPGDANWDATANGRAANLNAIQFAAAAANYTDTVEFVAITDSNNNVIFAGQLNSPKTVTIGQVFQFNVGDLVTLVS